MTDVAEFYEGLAEPLREKRALAAEHSASSKRNTSWFGFTYPDPVNDYGFRLARLGHASKLTDEAAARWATVLLSLPRQAFNENNVYSWKPWVEALEEHGLSRESLSRDAWAAGVGPWPPEHAGRLSFAMAFLETDLTFFRSGYTKKYLIARIRDLSRDVGAIRGRCTALVKRAIMEGCGLEEAREYRKLAAAVAGDELMGWLEEKARDARLSTGDLPFADRWNLPALAKRRELEMTSRRHRELARLDATGRVVERVPRERIWSKENLAARDAFRTLRHVEIARGLPSRVWNPAV